MYGKCWAKQEGGEKLRDMSQFTSAPTDQLNRELLLKTGVRSETEAVIGARASSCNEEQWDRVSSQKDWKEFEFFIIVFLFRV